MRSARASASTHEAGTLSSAAASLESSSGASAPWLSPTSGTGESLAGPLLWLSKPTVPYGSVPNAPIPLHPPRIRSAQSSCRQLITRLDQHLRRLHLGFPWSAHQ